MTDAETLAAAEAEVAAALARIEAAKQAEVPVIGTATEVAKAVRLPSAEAALILLQGGEASEFLTLLEAAIATNLDDIPRPSGTPGVEGAKQILQRIATSMRSGLLGVQHRVASLQPLPAPPAPVEPEA